MRNVVKGHIVEASALAALGRFDEATAAADAALSGAERIGNPAQIRRSHMTRGAALAADGRATEAADAYRSALASADVVAAGLADAELRATFLGSAEISRIRKGASV